MPAEPTTSAIRANIAANIRRLRVAMNLSQEELAELADCHRTYISQLERLASNLSVDRLERIAKVLNVQATQLMEPPPEQFE